MQSCCLVEIFRVKQHLSNFSFFSEKHIDLGIFEEFIIEIYRNTCFNFQISLSIVLNSSFNDDYFYFYRLKNLHEHFDIKIYRKSQGKNTKGTDYKSPHSVMAVLWRSLSALSCRRLPIIPGAKLMQLSINIYTH